MGKEIVDLMLSLAPEENINETVYPGVSVYKASRHVPPIPLLYKQGIVIVGQGSKRIHLGDVTYNYDPDNYLVISVPLPAECETFGTEDKPFVCMLVDIEMKVLTSIIDAMDDNQKGFEVDCKSTGYGLFVANTNDEFKCTVSRLLLALQTPLESKVLAPGLVKELVFRVMCGENASSLRALAIKNSSVSRVDKALKQIHSSYQKSMDVEQLANLVNMSMSSFHRAFKEVTSTSPIQYIKKVRLNKARAFMAEEGLKVNQAADAVGYESVTQFSREFKRYFGTSPVGHVRK
jgi:AraC-like DNA-binding protein